MTASDEQDTESDETTAPDDAPTQRPHRDATAAFADRVRDALPEAVERCYLFGSVARETATPTSDVDVLAVIADEADYGAVDDRLLEIAYDVQLEFEVPVEVHSLLASEFADRRTQADPFVRSVLLDGERLV